MHQQELSPLTLALFSNHISLSGSTGRKEKKKKKNEKSPEPGQIVLTIWLEWFKVLPLPQLQGNTWIYSSAEAHLLCPHHRPQPCN